MGPNVTGAASQGRATATACRVATTCSAGHFSVCTVRFRVSVQAVSLDRCDSGVAVESYDGHDDQ
jgi:hypothetical protein